MNIELYSIKSFTGSALKNKLETALAEKGLPYEVKEIHNVDAFIKAGLNSVPAVKVGNRIVEYHEDAPIDETVQKTLAMILENSEQLLLVPVDFSPESMHALRYARMLALHMKMGVTVSHIHQPLFDPVTGSAFDADVMHHNRLRLDEMIVEAGWDKVVDGGFVPVNVHFDAGDIATHIHHLMKDEKYEMVVLSTKSEDSFMRRVFGTVSGYITKTADKPVLVVPPHTELKFPKKIVVGLTEVALHGTAVEYILDFATRNHLFIEFAFATNDEREFGRLRQSLSEILLARAGMAGYEIRSIPFREENVAEELMVHAGQLDADMVVLITRHRNFLQSIGHQSVTRKVLSHPLKPVLIVHEA
jgi:nucleotide-binding universal stress UspA family protein